MFGRSGFDRWHLTSPMPVGVEVEGDAGDRDPNFGGEHALDGEPGLVVQELGDAARNYEFGNDRTYESSWERFSASFAEILDQRVDDLSIRARHDFQREVIARCLPILLHSLPLSRIDIDVNRGGGSAQALGIGQGLPDGPGHV